MATPKEISAKSLNFGNASQKTCSFSEQVRNGDFLRGCRKSTLLDEIKRGGYEFLDAAVCT
jgi:hypothetical protein